MKKNNTNKNKDNNYIKYKVYKEITVPKKDKYGINDFIKEIDNIIDLYELPVTKWNFMEQYNIEYYDVDYFEEDPDGKETNDVTGASGTWIPEETFDKKGKAIISVGYWDSDNEYVHSDFNVIAQRIIDKKDVNDFIGDFEMFAEKYFLSYKGDYKIEEIK